MKSRKDKEKISGFFCRKVFMEQLVLLETPAQFLELFGAAYAYIDDEEFEIKDNMVKMAFSSWKIALNYDKEYHKERKANSIQANEAKKKKREAKGNILMNSPSDEESAEEPPLVDVEEVEKYPFEEFWKIYGKEVGFEECQRIWNRQFSNETKAEIMAHVVEYVKARPNVYFRKDPINYFKDRCWKDKVITNPQTENNYGSNNGQQNGRTQQQINIERNAQAVAKLFSEIRPMQPDGGDN
nr:MAG TPA: putative replisome organizer protein [Caudoviricetes sp.]